MSLPKAIRLSAALKNIKVVSFGYMPLPEEWEEQSELVRKEGYEQSLEEINAIKQEMATLKDRICMDLNAGFSDMVEQFKTGIPDLLIEISKKVLGVISIEKEQILSIIDEVLSECSLEDKKLLLYLSKEDMEILKKCNVEEKNKYQHIQFEEDEHLQRGDCVVKTDFGILDARMDTKLDQIKKEIS